jgi:cellulose synthase/poly-beta-1,6-N-acetylglucosamine synthase-like glycosyltransferase
VPQALVEPPSPAAPAPVQAVTSRARAAPVVHGLALLLALSMFGWLVAELAPLWREYARRGDTAALVYLTLACSLIPIYWPSACYRLLLLLATYLVVPRAPTKAFAVLPPASLPPVCVVVPTRNEPAEIVVPLLRSLCALGHREFEVVLADNSDLFLADGRLNDDLVDIMAFAEEARVRVLRRAVGKPDRDGTAHLPRILRESAARGDTRGGKAANLNAALASAEARYEWFMLLDADSSLSEATLAGLLSVAVQGGSQQQPVGFVQSALASSNGGESTLSRALSVLDACYYEGYFVAKASFGVVSNWGHGVLVARGAWQATRGFPLEISEDLAWANELLLHGHCVNYFALCRTLERKPATWSALKVQRDRWARGTTMLMRTQLASLWRSPRLRWYEKLDITYDMMSYALSAAGCLLPVFFLFASVLGSGHHGFFRTLIPAFYFVMAMDNLLIPLESLKMLRQGYVGAARRSVAAMPFISVILGAISSQVCIGVLGGLTARSATFRVTPKGRTPAPVRWTSIIDGNKFCFALSALQGWMACAALDANPGIVPLLALSPVAYFLAPFLDRATAHAPGLASAIQCTTRSDRSL